MIYVNAVYPFIYEASVYSCRQSHTHYKYNNILQEEVRSTAGLAV